MRWHGSQQFVDDARGVLGRDGLEGLGGLLGAHPQAAGGAVGLVEAAGGAGALDAALLLHGLLHGMAHLALGLQAAEVLGHFGHLADDRHAVQHGAANGPEEVDAGIFRALELHGGNGPEQAGESRQDTRRGSRLSRVC